MNFTDEVEALQRQVDKLQALGYNKIIALGHSGFEVDQQIAKRVRGVDVVIGGHTNTFLYTGTSPTMSLFGSSAARNEAETQSPSPQGSRRPRRCQPVPTRSW